MCWLCSWRWHCVDKTQNFDYNAAEHTHTHCAQIHTECKKNLCSMFAPEVGNLLCALSSNDYFISFKRRKIESIRIFSRWFNTDARSTHRIAVHISCTHIHIRCLRTHGTMRKYLRFFHFQQPSQSVKWNIFEREIDVSKSSGEEVRQNDMSFVEKTRQKHLWLWLKLNETKAGERPTRTDMNAFQKE